MPKMKTNSACKKRFKKNCNGKIKRTKAFRRHHAWAKNAKRVRDLRSGSYIDASFSKGIAMAMPYA